MSEINDGGPAFPQVRDEGMNAWPGAFGLGGMSLRDWFAGQALAGNLACSEYRMSPRDGETGWDVAARDAWTAADAMLAARERGAA